MSDEEWRIVKIEWQVTKSDAFKKIEWRVSYWKNWTKNDVLLKLND
jgi:hypothetical protein